MFYVYFLGVILLWLFIGADKRVSTKIYATVPLALMAIIIGLRNTGADIGNYKRMYDSLINGNYSLFFTYDVEISYLIICKIFQLLSMKFQAVLLFYACMSFFFIILTIQKAQLLKADIALFILLFYSVMFSTYFIIMRQFLAASILVYAFFDSDNLQKAKKKTVVLILLSGLFHYGAFLVLPVYFLASRDFLKSNKRKIVVLLLVAFLGESKIIFSLANLIMKLFTKYYYYSLKSNYGIARDLSITMLVFTVTYICILAYDDWAHSKFDCKEIVSTGTLTTLIIFFLTYDLGWLNRAYWYTNIFLGFLPYWVIRFFKQGKSRTITFLIVLFLETGYALYSCLRIGGFGNSNMIP